MAKEQIKPKTGAAKPAPFDVNNLTEEQLMLACEKYVGIHPKYWWFRGLSIDIDVYKLSMDGINWTGFVDRNKGK